MLSFDDKKYMEVRPFTSKSVHDPIVSAKALETFRGLSRLNDHTYLSYLLYVDQNIEFALKNSTFRSKHVQDLLLELQSMVYKAEENKIAEELIAVTKQLLFKFSADFLISSDEEKDLICILSSLSYHSVDCVIFENTDLAAYSAILALDSLTLLLHTYDDTYGNVWTDSELGCHIVHAIIPNDEHICRLHSALYQNARDCSESLLPMLKDELPETFADHILPFLEHDRILRILIMAMRRLPITETEYSFNLFRFFNHFVRQLKTTPSQNEFAKFDSKFFTSADFALFLEWLKQWSEVSQSTVKIASKIVFTKEQLVHWESITAHIKEQRITSEQRLRVSSVIRTVRLDKSFRNIRILYAIFKFIRENAFPSIWRQGYASLIVKNLQNIEYTETSKNHLFHIMAFEEMISVDEEELIYRDLEKSLAPPTDFEPNDENKNNSVCGSGQEKEKETKSYTIYSHYASNTPERAASEADSVENYETSQSPPTDGEISQSFFITDISIDEESYILNAIQQTLHSTMQMYKDVEGSIAASLDKRLGPDPEDCRMLHSYSIQPAINSVLRDGDLLSFLDQQMKLDTAKDAEKISSLIERCGNLKALELKGNTLGIEAGERISASLERHSELQRCLWSDLFTGRLKTEIPPVLRCLTNALITARCHITELDLSDNAFGPIGAEGIQDFLISPAAYTLEVLKLNNNGLGGGGKIIAECLLQCHANANRDRTQFKLKTFVAGRNRLEDPGAIALAKAFSAIGTLENIQIPQNGIRLKGITALAESFEYNRHLKTIVLNDNTCGADGAYLIAKSLTNLVNLEILDLGDCLCRSNGCRAVIDVVCDGRHHNIKMVDLSGSELFGREGKNIINTWKERFGRSNSKLLLSHNMFGGLFNELQDIALSSLPNVCLGSISDDEGSGSEKYSSSESSDSEDIRSDDQSGDDIQLERLHIADEACDEGLLSFLDQQMKLDTAKDAEKISSLIERCGNLKALELKGNTLGIEAGERISASLERHSELQRCLWSDLFTGRLKTEIPPVLRCLTNALITARCHITELDLSDNAFGPIGAEGIQDFLISPAAYTLEVLKLNNNGLGGGGKIIAECLLQCHANANRDRTQFKLKTFVAGRNRLEDPGAIALAKAFSAIGTLENIQIPQNGIRLKGITALAESFEYNRHLKTIVLNDNTCGADGAYLIAKSLTNLVNLEILDLGDCLCRSDGCGAVIAVVCDGRHHNIKMVDLSGSELPAKRASLIITSWMQSFTCTGAFLKLSNNMFGSMFPKLEDRIKAKSLKIDIGDIDDDEGSGDDDGESDEDGNC